MVDFNLAFFSSSEKVTVKTLLKSVHIYQSYCKKKLLFFPFYCLFNVCVLPFMVNKDVYIYKY